MSKTIFYSENPQAFAVIKGIMESVGIDNVVTNDTIAFRGVDNSAVLQLINAGESFEPAAKLALRLLDTTSAAVMVLTDQPIESEGCAALLESGALIVEKPLSKHLLTQALRDALSLQGRLRKMAALLEETRRIARAKMILVQARGMTEPEAHRYLEREAMNRRITRLEIAEEIISAGK